MPADITEAIDTARAIKAVAYDAGYQSGYEAGLRAAQTQIDAAAAEHGRAEERARVVALFAQRMPIEGEFISAPDMLAAIRSGEPAPEGAEAETRRGVRALAAGSRTNDGAAPTREGGSAALGRHMIAPKLAELRAGRDLPLPEGD
jgi:hypothetical protein